LSNGDHSFPQSHFHQHHDLLVGETVKGEDPLIVRQWGLHTKITITVVARCFVCVCVAHVVLLVEVFFLRFCVFTLRGD